MLTREKYLELVHEAETCEQFKNSPTLGYEAVAEKLFDASYDATKGEVKKDAISFTALLEAELSKRIPGERILLAGHYGDEFMDKYKNDPRVMEAVTSGAFPTITSTFIQKATIKAYEYNSNDLLNLINEDSWTGGDTSKATIPGMRATGKMLPRAEAASYTGDDTHEDYVDIYLHDFGRKIALTWEAVKSDRTGMLLQRAEAMGKAGALHRAEMVTQTIEMVAARSTMPNEAATKGAVFNGQTALTQANIYANTHAAVTGLDAQVNDNVVTTSTALDHDGLKEAWGLLRKMTDGRGKKIMVEPNVLLVPSDLAVDAYSLLKTVNIPGTTDFGTNFFKDKFKIVDSVFFSDTNSWYLGDFKSQITWIWVDKPRTLRQGTSSDAFFNNKIVAEYLFAYHGGCGHTDYRYVVRSPGIS